MGHHKATIEFPDSYKDAAVKKFLVDYFETSNTPDAHGHASNAFTEKGVFVLGSHRAEGRSSMSAPRSCLASPAHLAISSA